MRVILMVLCCVLSLVGCTTQTAEEQVNSSIVYGLTLEPSGIDPHRNQSAELGIVLRQVYDTLVYRHPETGEFVSGLATDWTISEDGLIYTFNLRQDVTFHDGTPFNAQAVAANLDRITGEDTMSQKAVFMLGPYLRYDLIDEDTISIVLSEPFAPLLDSLSQVYLGMASQEAFSQYSINRYQYHQVGTGPYRFISYTPGDDIVLRRNENYTWGPSFYSEDANPADEIVYRFFSDPATRSVALESGEAQIMGELPPSDARALTGNSQVQLLPTTIPGQPLQFMMNTQRYPTDNIVVRQALTYATNRNVIVDTVFQGFSPIAWGPLAESTLYYNANVVGMYDYNLQQARALLTSVGFVDADNNGYFDAGDDDLTVNIIVPPWGLLPQVAQLLQDQWRDAGVRVELRQVPGFTALREAVAEGEYNLVAFNTFGYDPVLLNEYFFSDGTNNYTNFENPELDNALRLAARELNPASRRTLYGQIQQFIMEQALILPIRDYVNLNATTPAIRGLVFDIYGWFPLMINASITGA